MSVEVLLSGIPGASLRGIVNTALITISAMLDSVLLNGRSRVVTEHQGALA